MNERQRGRVGGRAQVLCEERGREQASEWFMMREPKHHRRETEGGRIAGKKQEGKNLLNLASYIQELKET